MLPAVNNKVPVTDRQASMSIDMVITIPDGSNTKLLFRNFKQSL